MASAGSRALLLLHRAPPQRHTTHLELEINWLEAPALKLHYGFELLIVFSLEKKIRQVRPNRLPGHLGESQEQLFPFLKEVCPGTAPHEAGCGGKSRILGGGYVQRLSHHLGCPQPIGVPGFESFLPIYTLGGSRRGLKYLNSCHPCGTPGGVPASWHQAGPALAIVGICGLSSIEAYQVKPLPVVPTSCMDTDLNPS